MRVDVVSGKAWKLIIVLLSLTLIMEITTVAVALQDMIFTYSDNAYAVPQTTFNDGGTVYVKVTDTETKGGTKPIRAENNTKGNTISVNVTDSNSDSFYLGSFIVYSGANDDAKDKLALFYGESATITADLADDGSPGTKTITASYIPPAPTNLTAAPIAEGSIRLSWTACSPETNVAQYNIYRATSSGAQDFSSPTYTVSVGITSYTDNSATPGQVY